jgi:transposase
MGSEVISVVERRRRWSTEEKLQILMAALEPGASVSSVADRHGVTRGLVYTWLRLAREGRLEGLSMKAAPPSGFVPVCIAPDARAKPGERSSALPQPAAPELQSQSGRAPPPARRRSGAVEIKLPNGRVVKVGEGIDPSVLAAIIDALDSGSRLRQDGEAP